MGYAISELRAAFASKQGHGSDAARAKPQLKVARLQEQQMKARHQPAAAMQKKAKRSIASITPSANGTTAKRKKNKKKMKKQQRVKHKPGGGQQS